MSTEPLALFARFWLTVTPPLPPEGQTAAQASGRERYEGFIEALGRRLNQGRTFLDGIPNDIAPTGSAAAGGGAHEDIRLRRREASPGRLAPPDRVYLVRR